MTTITMTTEKRAELSQREQSLADHVAELIGAISRMQSDKTKSTVKRERNRLAIAGYIKVIEDLNASRGRLRVMLGL